MNLRWLAALSICALTGVWGDDNMPANQEAKTFRHEITSRVELKYLLFLPDGYQQDSGKRWPLLLFLHGAGERGTNLSRVAVHGPPKIVKEKKDFPFIVVSPQCPSGQTWSDEALLSLLDDVQKTLRVDESRIYLSGLSMGGYGTWSLGTKHPDRFAAIAPICGGGSILPILLPQSGKEASLKRLPIWVFHGAKDPVVPLRESEEMVDALKRAGNQDIKFTIYPEAGHDSWTEAYANEELYDWFLQHSREKKTSRRKALRATGEG